MISKNSKYGMSPRKPAIRHKKDGEPFTCFSVSDKVTGQGVPDKTYQYYNMIVWNEAIELDPSDKVYIEEIEGISTGWYNNKPQITISCKIRVVKTAECPYIPSSDFTDTTPTPTSNFFPTDDTSLPFDL